MALLISRADVASVLTMKECISMVEDAFAQLARGETVMPQRVAFRVEKHHGLFLGMPAYIGGGMDALGLKVVTVYPDNPKKHKKPTIFGTLILLDPETGECRAIMDAGYLTAVRTGAASGVATKYMARKNAKTCALFGAGVQARKQIEAVHLVRPLDTVWVIDPDDDARDRFAKEMGDEMEITVVPTSDVEAAVRAADIVVTASSSPTPVFDGDWLKPGTHINNIGSHSPGARELDTATVKRSYYVADLKEASLAEAGDILIPIQEGAVTEDHIVAGLGEVVIGEKPGRKSEEQITLFKSCGLAIQDISSAMAVYKAAVEKGVGTEIQLS
ncbi:MAG: ornithine cyclodeaminase family protein [Candidatus Eisenbacteria bacterium]|nr:ornithine cyclodeaminase family protein [Candidatus Eisenbacteria bacterium]